MASWTTKVRCSYCGKGVIRKNLLEHSIRIHDTNTVKFTAIDMKDIRTMFKPSESPSDSEEEPSNKKCRLEAVVTEQKSVNSSNGPQYENKTCDETPSVSTNNDTQVYVSKDSLDQIKEMIKQLENKVDSNICHKDHNSGLNKKVTESKSGDILSLSDELLPSCRSIRSIITLEPIFEEIETGLQCTACQTIIKYDKENGTSFSQDVDLPRPFRTLKFSIVRHLKYESHKASVERKNKYDKELEKLKKQSQESAINCASLAYFTYMEGTSILSYETLVTTNHAAGGNVGNKNHSKRFASDFLEPMYQVVKNSVIDYVINEELPFGILADKMTASHRKRHIMGMRIPIWSLDHPSICSDIYLRHASIGYGSGKAVSDHLLEMCKSMGFPINFIRKHLSGLAMDGQYTNLHVDEHVANELLTEVNLSWDPAHRIELAHKDSKKSSKGNFVEKTLNIINKVQNHFKTGNSFEHLLTLSDLSEVFLTPKSFKDMKFISHSCTVFSSFISDFKSFVAGLNKDDDDFILRDKILDSGFIFDMLFLSDLCITVGRFSKLVQQVNKLPWQYGNNINQLKISLQRGLHSLEQLLNKFDKLDILNNVGKMDEFLTDP